MNNQLTAKKILEELLSTIQKLNAKELKETIDSRLNQGKLRKIRNDDKVISRVPFTPEESLKVAIEYVQAFLDPIFMIRQAHQILGKIRKDEFSIIWKLDSIKGIDAEEKFEFMRSPLLVKPEDDFEGKLNKISENQAADLQKELTGIRTIFAELDWEE